jgi:hypothetical protein
MIAVAIVMILAALAIPQVRASQLKAKKAEIPTNLDSILTAAIAYEAAFDSFGSNSGQWNPGPYYDKEAHAWDDGNIPPIWQNLPWSPDGDVRATYYYYPDPTGPTDYVYCHGYADMDADGNRYQNRWAYDTATKQIDPSSVETCSTGGSPTACF